MEKEKRKRFEAGIDPERLKAEEARLKAAEAKAKTSAFDLIREINESKTMDDEVKKLALKIVTEDLL